MDNHDVKKAADNDPAKIPGTSYPAEEAPVVPQQDGDDNDPPKIPGTSLTAEGE